MRRLHSLTALRAFEAVSRLKSISAAAEELRVTRPAVSKQVTQLEATLGLQLLVRSGNVIQLTAAGEELFDGLRRSFDLMSATLAAVGRSMTHHLRAELAAQGPLIPGDNTPCFCVTNSALTAPCAIEATVSRGGIAAYCRGVLWK